MGIAIRWALVASTALLGMEYLSDAWFSAGLALLALSNLVAMRLCCDSQVAPDAGRKYMSVMRVIDVLAVAAACFDSPMALDNLWLLAIPTILAESLASSSPRRVLLLTAAAVAVPSLHIIRDSAQIEAVRAVIALGFSAAVGLVLGNYRARERALEARHERLETMLNCTTALAACSDLRELLLGTLKASIGELRATCGYVMLTSPESKGELLTEVAFSTGGEFRFPERIQIGVGVTGYAVKMGQPIAIHGEHEERFDLEGVDLTAKSIVSVPLVARNFMGAAQATTEHVLGAITLLGASDSSFSSAEDMQLLRSLASLLAEAVANSRMEERQRTTFLMTLETLAKSLEARDVYTQGHSQRVCDVSQMIGEKLFLSAEALEELRVGTILHDIGKIGVPDSILNKPSRLTDEEFATMKSHPVIGYEICKPLGLSEGVLMIIRNHHEKLDGSGYPDGLKGGELPLSLRIVCVADAFDAMSSRRPYRDVMQMNRVLAELSSGAGVQFDPVVVEALKDLLPTERMQTCYRGQWEVEEKAA